jgi:hypothetical protein
VCVNKIVEKSKLFNKKNTKINLLKMKTTTEKFTGKRFKKNCSKEKIRIIYKTTFPESQ